MPNQPPDYQTAAEVLNRARTLFSLADYELVRGTGSIPDADISARLWRAQTYALVATAGAHLAQAMMVQDDVTFAEEFDRSLGSYPIRPSGHLVEILKSLRERDTDGG